MTVKRWSIKHGEGPLNVVATGLVIWLLSGLTYAVLQSLGMRIYEEVPKRSLVQNGILDTVLNGLHYSGIAFFSLSYGPFTPTNLGSMAAAIEAGIGSIFVALLVFVLGRRVAR